MAAALLTTNGDSRKHPRSARHRDHGATLAAMGAEVELGYWTRPSSDNDLRGALSPLLKRRMTGQDHARSTLVLGPRLPLAATPVFPCRRMRHWRRHRSPHQGWSVWREDHARACYVEAPLIRKRRSPACAEVFRQITVTGTEDLLMAARLRCETSCRTAPRT